MYELSYRKALLGASIDLDALLWAATVTVSASRLRLVSKTIKSLKGAGLWTLLDRFYVTAGENALQGRTCWRTRVTLSTINGPTFTANRGYAGDGLSSYLDINYIASTQGVQYTLNSASLFGYFNTTRAGADSTAAFGTDNGTGVQTAMSLRLAAGTQDAYLNNTFAAGHANAAVTDTLGLATVSRTASNLTATYRRAASLATTAAAASAVPTVTMAVLAFNNNSSIINYETARCAAFGIGAALSVAQVATLNTILEGHLTAVGANA